MRIVARSKKLNAILQKQLRQFAYPQPQEVPPLRYYPAVYGLSILVLCVGILAFPVLMLWYVYVPLQRAFFSTDAIVIPSDGQYVFMMACILLWPLLYMLSFCLLRKIIPSVDRYFAVTEIRDNLEFTLQLKKAKTAAAQKQQLQELAGQYDWKRFSWWRIRRNILGVVIMTLIISPFIFLAFNSYTIVGGDGIRVNSLWSTHETLYAWADVDAADLRAEHETSRSDGEEHVVPTLDVTMHDGTTVDLWQFGVLQRSSEHVIPLCAQLDEHGIEVVQHPLPNISKLRESIQRDVHAVWDSTECGAFDVCSTLPEGSVLGSMLECD